jgi:hypothetical protein
LPPGSADDVDRVPAGTPRRRSSASSFNRMQPCEILDPSAPIRAAPPSGPWIPMTASPEPSQEPIACECADVTITNAPYPGLGGSS